MEPIIDIAIIINLEFTNGEKGVVIFESSNIADAEQETKQFLENNIKNLKSFDMQICEKEFSNIMLESKVLLNQKNQTTNEYIYSLEQSLLELKHDLFLLTHGTFLEKLKIYKKLKKKY